VLAFSARQRKAVGRQIIALVIIIIALAIALVSVVFDSGSMVRTVTVTTTVPPTQQATAMVDGSFAQHMVLLSTGNVSAIVSQYETNANVTWTGKSQCYDGFYNGTGYITELMDAFLLSGTPALAIGNVTMTTTSETNGTVLVNSEFGFASPGPSGGGMVNGTVSAQDLYGYSATRGAWLISQESWDFLSFNGQIPRCGAF